MHVDAMRAGRHEGGQRGRAALGIAVLVVGSLLGGGLYNLAGFWPMFALAAIVILASGLLLEPLVNGTPRRD